MFCAKAVGFGSPKEFYGPLAFLWVFNKFLRAGQKAVGFWNAFLAFFQTSLLKMVFLGHRRQEFLATDLSDEAILTVGSVVGYVVATMKTAKTILVADDDPAVVALVSTQCQQKGYRVLEALDGQQALDLFAKEEPDLVVLDVMMPEHSGWEVARTLRHTPAGKQVKILMLTGIGEQLNAMTAPLYGVDAHLDKPFEWSELEKKIVQLVGDTK